MKSIKVKLAVIVISLFVVALGLLAGFNYWQAKKLLIHDAEDEILGKVHATSVEVSLWIDGRMNEVAAIARSPIMTGGNHQAMQAYVQGEKNSNKIYENVFFTDRDGNFDSAGIKGSVAARPYFQQAIKGNGVISDPVISSVTGKPVVVIAVPLRDANGSTSGILAGAIYVEEVEKRVLSVKTGETGYAYVLRQDGTVIFHPKRELVNKVNVNNDSNATAALKAVTEKMLKGQEGIASYDYMGVDKYLAYAPIQGTSWAMAVTVPASEVVAKLSSFTWMSLGIICSVLTLAILVILLTAARIAKPLGTLEAAANRIAGGDLSMELIPVNSQDELGRLARAFEAMVNNLRSLVRQIGDSSEQVAASSEELTANAEQSAQAANQVAASITAAAHGADRQVSGVNNTAALVEQITGGARQEASNSKNAVDIAARAVAAATEGKKAVDTATLQMDSIRQTVDNSAQVVTELGERSKEIGQIVAAISSIASQTNLLALNAAIEAARAGEQGRGFAVVAEEVRKLAEQSQDAAKQIAVLIGDIQGKTDEAVVAMSNGTHEVRRGTEVVDQAGKAFQAIDVQVKEVAGIVQGTANGLNQLAVSSQQVLVVIQETAQISREISSQTQTISAATEEQSASMEEIAASSQHLAQLAEQLQSAVVKFKL